MQSDVDVDDYKKSFDVKDTHADTIDDINPPAKRAKKDEVCLFPSEKVNIMPDAEKKEEKMSNKFAHYISR